jgi:endonuclease/exonuclease/phosphatase family metal-dependent hydrolase
MNAIPSRPVVRLLALALALLSAILPTASRGASAELKVMTYNLRYASDKGANAWPDRRPVMKELLEANPPDLLGTQEGLYAQLKDLATDLPRHEWIGLGRDGGSRGEFMAIFYLRERFDPIEYDHFWLSDTPEVIASSTWGNTNRRMVTWVRFKDRVTDREFYFWNTHLDHALQPAREKAAELIRQRVGALKLPLPVILVGDFNAVSTRNKTHEILVKDDFFRDTWFLAGSRRNEDFNTFTGFQAPRRESERIDWILLRGKGTVGASEIVTFQRNHQLPSDHFPVVAGITLTD